MGVNVSPRAAWPPEGRKAQAAADHTAILEAARAVFVVDPGAPIADVAARAGVGISALYRRYPSEEELLRKVCGDGLLDLRRDRRGRARRQGRRVEGVQGVHAPGSSEA